MSHGKLREDKTCQNCGAQVDEHFCPHCGQENIETRQPFHYLFTHFFEDLTHYDGQLWKTVKYLLFFPGKLTNQYLAGKRQQFVPPVKLYIFISFITFLMIAFSGFGEGVKEGMDSAKTSHAAEKAKEEMGKINAAEIFREATKEGNFTQKDSLRLAKNLNLLEDSTIIKSQNNFVSLLKSEKIDKKINFFDAQNLDDYEAKYKNSGFFFNVLLHPIAEKFFELRDHNVSKKEIINGFIATFFHTLPKALFLYLPFFAFLLWLFHNKKKWWYFDHGIFTLHYFSFLLLILFLSMLISAITSKINSSFVDSVFSFISVITIFYTIFYFFFAHHRVYDTKRATSIGLGILIFFLNSIGFLLMLTILVYLSFVMIH